MTAETLTPTLRSVAELFDDGTLYTVPVYQRSYAWDAVQIEQLISDVRDAMQADEETYFLGNLVVTRRDSTEDEHAPADYEVIDGQQRLTTLYLILTYLANKLPTDERLRQHRGRLRYESRPRSTEALRRFDAGYPDRSIKISVDSDDDSGIEHGYNVIHQFFADAQNGIPTENRPDFVTYLLDSVQVVRAALPKSTDLNRYFEVMNTRGVQLQPVDIVKARLMSVLDDHSERDCFAWIWDSCAEMDAYVQVTLTRGNTKLRGKLFGKDWSWLRVTDFAELCTYREGVPGKQQAISSEGLSLDSALELYAESSTDESTSDTESERFSSTITFPSLLLHALKLFTSNAGATEDAGSEDEGQLDDKRLIDLFETKLNLRGATKFTARDTSEVKRFAEHLLRVRTLFDAFILKREFTATYAEEGQWSLSKVVCQGSGRKSTIGYRNTFAMIDEDDDAQDASTRDLLLLESMLRVTYTAPRTMHWITRLLRQALKFPDPTEISAADLITPLRKYVRCRVRDSFKFGDSDGVGQTEGFEIPRIVFTYLDYLLIEENKVTGFDRNYLFSFRTSVEHFYPQHPNPEQGGERISPDNLHKLGNLALVSVGANSKFSNNMPVAKTETYKETIVQQSPKLHLMANLTRENNGWGDKELLAHHNKMLHLLRSDLYPHSE